MTANGAHTDGGAGDEFDAAAAELLVVAPADFVAARNARATEAPGALGTRIRGLRKPTVAAWAVNLLSRDPSFREALELSGALREAQDDLDAAELARLGKQRRALVAALARRSADLAEEAGVALSAAARDEVERTVNAAIVDAVAGAVVGAGRLVRTLEPGSLDSETLADRVAGSIPGVAEAPARPRDDLAERRARREAEKRRREAQREASEAGRALARAEERRSSARERADRLHERAEELRRDLARVSEDAERADAAVDDLDDAVASARESLAAAERKVRAADGDGQ
ncbi:transposase [Microbacterium sp. Ru50]|uniref:transposase n=1 Tax=Microbacterium sp. Ru50 TaxID=2080744 RepID=UPI000CDE3752|nr:transposase [Microbacterium sp. Ru50]POX66268.1 transposase [Microbacterium sp. Ru50]